jgi:hypothetical protein
MTTGAADECGRRVVKKPDFGTYAVTNDMEFITRVQALASTRRNAAEKIVTIWLHHLGFEESALRYAVSRFRGSHELAATR